MINNKFWLQAGLILILLVTQSVFTVSAQTRKVKFDETFTLVTDEEVETEDGKLKVRSKGVGRTISKKGEVEYVELLVSLNNSEHRIVISERGERTKSIGNYSITLVNADSFGRSSCQLRIARKK